MTSIEPVGGIVRWEDPPPVGRSSSQRPWAVVAMQLRQHPGRWALIDEATTNPSLTVRIAAGSAWWKPRGAFRACLRVVDGHLNIYACYVGAPADVKEPE